MQTFLLKKYKLSFVDSETSYPYTLCKIRDYNKSLEKVWHVEYYIFDIDKQEPGRKRVTLSQTTKKARYEEGKRISEEIDALLQKGAVFSKKAKKAVSIKDIDVSTINENSGLMKAISAYSSHTKKVLEPKTWDTYNTDIKRFIAWLIETKSKHTLLSFENTDAIRFLDSLAGKISNRSINNNRNTIKTLFNFYIKRHKKKLSENPFEGIDKLPAQEKKHRPFLAHEKKAFIREAKKKGEHQLILFCEFIYYTFLRPGKELRLLQVSHILPNRTIRVESDTAKGKVTDFVRIPLIFWDEIQRLKILDHPKDYYVFSKSGLPGPDPVIRDFFYDKHVEVLKNASLHGRRIDMYAWKHTGATELFIKTQNIWLIKEQCRHRHLDSTIKYIRDLGLMLKNDQIDEFPPFDPLLPESTPVEV